jgi:hypothetical protein
MWVTGCRQVLVQFISLHLAEQARQRCGLAINKALTSRLLRRASARSKSWLLRTNQQQTKGHESRLAQGFERNLAVVKMLTMER